MTAGFGRFVSRAQVPMTISTADVKGVRAVEPSDADVGGRRISLGWVIVFATWCGLVAGLLEVAAFVVRKWCFDPNHFYGMSRHFVWLIPVTNLLVFLIVGVCGWLCSRLWFLPEKWLFSTGIGTLTILPATLVAFPRIYGIACLALALGLASQVVRILNRAVAHRVRLVVLSWPIVAGSVLGLAAALWIDDRAKQAREEARPLPAAGTPNVLLLVLDTVAAAHLDLYGHTRSTSTSLIEIAERGIRFDAARAGSSWTLPSHATMFTGRSLHELVAGWQTPLNSARPTLAEYLGTRGYATAGFTANYEYCARDSGLARGFTHYEDFWLPGLNCFKMAVLVNRAVAAIQSIEDFCESELEITRLRPIVKYVKLLLDSNRKWAHEINRELLDWLSNRGQPERPFFAFLNYYDAHSPYQLPPGRPYRFGAVPDDARLRGLILKWETLDKKYVTPADIEFAATSYDECVADLDEQLGVLFDELERRGVLERTWLIVAADHGESFGEHAGVFCHGSSLYQTEVHVPLVIVPPGGMTKRVVTDAVSLRDLPATVVDVLGIADGSPFPGASVAPLWRQAARPAVAPHGSSVNQALTEVVPLDTWPLAGLTDGEWSYIRREQNAHEELFQLRVDRGEKHNRAGDPEARATLERMRARLNELTAGPLTPGRFMP